jgi:hypothetical protein
MHRICPVIAVCAWLMTSPAWAQAVDRHGAPFRLWDFAAGGGLHFEDASTIDGTNHEFGSWRGTGAVGLQGGRYWTSHLKTEAGVVYATTDVERLRAPLPVRRRTDRDRVVAPNAGGLRHRLHPRRRHLPDSAARGATHHPAGASVRGCGFKSYLTERSFVRSELSAAFGSRGLAQLSIGLGFGVDF